MLPAPLFPPLDDLNPQQRAAVLATEGPVLVLAGAGTGKTRVLTTRLAYLLHTGKVIPSRVLAVTFTNKAAAEMRSRVETLAGTPLEGFWLGTFHALCVRMLRRHAEKIGFTRDFTIIDTEDQLRLFKQLVQTCNLDDKEFPARMVAAVIGRWKDALMSPAEAATQGGTHKNKAYAALYALYQERLQTLNAMDFGDLLNHTIHLFRTFPDVLIWYQEHFRYILVDEYQDTNTAQYLWLRLLAQHNKNICCVGDDDQSIYGWRGADVQNILKFEEDFPGAQVIRLEQNYRSTPHILAAAGGLIAQNDGRLGKTLWTEVPHGELVTLHTLWNAEEEAAWVVDQVETHQRQKISLAKMGILVRAGFQTREFEERLLKVGVPYKVIGGLRFYERAEIRDAMAYFRLVNNPADSLAFERIINLPKRGVGPAALNQLHQLAREENIPLLEALRYALRDMLIKGKLRLTLMDFLAQYDQWRHLSATVHHKELAKTILEASGYYAMVKADKSEQAQGRMDNLRELVSAMADYPSLSAFLEHVSLVMDNMGTVQDDVLTLITLHSAKGLEYDVVFLPGWEEGVFPSQRTLQDTGKTGLEEERRLAYVGLTRARQKAYVTSAKNRQVYGKWQTCTRSRFMEEIPAQHVEDLARQDPWADASSSPSWGSSLGRGGHQGGHYGGHYGGQSHQKSVRLHQGDVLLAPSGQSQSGAMETLRAGDKVRHATYGLGTLLSLAGDRAEVFFPHTGDRRKIMLSFLEVV